MNMKALREHVQQLCEEHGYAVTLDCVRAALEDHLFVFEGQVDCVPSRSPEENEKSWIGKRP